MFLAYFDEFYSGFQQTITKANLVQVILWKIFETKKKLTIISKGSWALAIVLSGSTPRLTREPEMHKQNESSDDHVHDCLEIARIENIITRAVKDIIG